MKRILSVLLALAFVVGLASFGPAARAEGSSKTIVAFGKGIIGELNDGDTGDNGDWGGDNGGWGDNGGDNGGDTGGDNGGDNGGDYCNHNWERAHAKDPTCTEEGYYEYWCTRCGEVGWREPIPPLGHDFGTDGKSPTCSRCGAANPVDVNTDPVDPPPPAPKVEQQTQEEVEVTGTGRVLVISGPITTVNVKGFDGTEWLALSESELTETQFAKESKKTIYHGNITQLEISLHTEDAFTVTITVRDTGSKGGAPLGVSIYTFDEDGKLLSMETLKKGLPVTSEDNPITVSVPGNPPKDENDKLILRTGNHHPDQ